MSVFAPAILSYFIKNSSKGTEESLNSTGLTLFVGLTGFGLGNGTGMCLDKLI